MFCAFFSLLMLTGGVGVLTWLLFQRVTAHMRTHPEAAELIAKHVIAPLPTGGKNPEADDEIEPTFDPGAGK
jgi:hypothetical protein